jgi:hypothetical protein
MALSAESMLFSPNNTLLSVNKVVFSANIVLSADNTLFSADNTLFSADNTMLLVDNMVLSADNKVLSADNEVFSVCYQLVRQCYQLTTRWFQLITAKSESMNTHLGAFYCGKMSFELFYGVESVDKLEMPEYRKKVSPASLVLPLVRRVIPALTSVRFRWSRTIPVVPSYAPSLDKSSQWAKLV